MEVYFDDYLISDDKKKLDRAVILDYLARSYWAEKRPAERTLKSIEASVCYGVYHEGRQVGYARVVTDGATVFYLCDVFILEQYQGQGIGKKLVETVIQQHGDMHGILGTKDAHELYAKYGFEREPDRFMRRVAQQPSS